MYKTFNLIRFTPFNIKLYLLYNNKAIHKYYLSQTPMMVRGICLCGREPKYPEAIHMVEQVTTIPSHTGD